MDKLFDALDEDKATGGDSSKLNDLFDEHLQTVNASDSDTLTCYDVIALAHVMKGAPMEPVFVAAVEGMEDTMNKTPRDGVTVGVLVDILVKLSPPSSPPFEFDDENHALDWVSSTLDLRGGVGSGRDAAVPELTLYDVAVARTELRLLAEGKQPSPIDRTIATGDSVVKQFLDLHGNPQNYDGPLWNSVRTSEMQQLIVDTKAFLYQEHKRQPSFGEIAKATNSLVRQERMEIEADGDMEQDLLTFDRCKALVTYHAVFYFFKRLETKVQQHEMTTDVSIPLRQFNSNRAEFGRAQASHPRPLLARPGTLPKASTASGNPSPAQPLESTAVAPTAVDPATALAATPCRHPDRTCFLCWTLPERPAPDQCLHSDAAGKGINGHTVGGGKKRTIVTCPQVPSPSKTQRRTASNEKHKVCRMK